MRSRVRQLPHDSALVSVSWRIRRNTVAGVAHVCGAMREAGYSAHNSRDSQLPHFTGWHGRCHRTDRTVWHHRASSNELCPNFANDNATTTHLLLPSSVPNVASERAGCVVQSDHFHFRKATNQRCRDSRNFPSGHHRQFLHPRGESRGVCHAFGRIQRGHTRARDWLGQNFED